VQAASNYALITAGPVFYITATSTSADAATRPLPQWHVIQMSSIPS
jgi:hypothetical protein